MASAELNELIRKYALKNAIDYGKAEFSSVMSKAVGEAKKQGIKIEDLRPSVESAISEVNSMDKAALDKAYEKYSAEFETVMKEKREKTAKPRMILDGAEEGSFVTRFPPEPNGYLHIGHAKPLFLEDAFREIYKGKLILYFDDTNPKKEKQEYVDAIKKDLEWLGVKFDSEVYASDSITKEYELCRKLIENNGAYACSCSPEEIKKLRFEGKECAHRKRPVEESLGIFDSLVNKSYEGNDVVIRFKGDMAAENTTLRDPNIFRIVREKHYRQGDRYILWPTYSFNTPVNDSLNGVTDVIRSKEYELGDELYRRMLKALGMRAPRLHLEARFNIKGNVTSKRVLVDFISKGLLSGYDDPRLVTIAALRRRGIVPEAIKGFVLRQGMSKTDSTMRLQMLMDENKKFIDASAKRLFFVEKPQRLVLEEEIQKNVSIPLHPSNKELGSKSYSITGDSVIINSYDANEYSGKNVRLKGIGLVTITKSGETFYAKPAVDQDGYVNTIQWVPENAIKAEILLPGDPIDEDGNFNSESMGTIYGLVEPYIENIKVHENIQLERFGFAVLDSKDPFKLIFMTK